MGTLSPSPTYRRTSGNDTDVFLISQSQRTFLMRSGSRFALMATFLVAVLCIGEVASAADCGSGGGAGLFAGMRARREARQAAKASSCYSSSTGGYSYHSEASFSASGSFAAPIPVAPVAAYGFTQSQSACAGGACAIQQAPVQLPPTIQLPSPQSPPPPAKTMPTPQAPSKSPLSDNGEVPPPPNPYSMQIAPTAESVAAIRPPAFLHIR